MERTLGRQTRISTFADRIIEAGWLLAVLFIPYFFNLQTARHFEPDKATTLRAIVLVMLAAWVIKTLERISVLGERPDWKQWWRAPLAIPVLAYAGVFVLTTIFSVAPSISWWGGYNRLQGTYTNLTYIALFALILGNLRTREQLERIITAVILTGLGVTIYGLIQHADLDPLPWKGDTVTRIASTMGNSIFVAAYLIMVIPFVLYRITATGARIGQAAVSRARGDWGWLALGALVLVAQQAMLIGQLKFGVAVRTPDFRYWWVFPGALIIVTIGFALLSNLRSAELGRRLAITAAVAITVWITFLLLVFAASSGEQQLDSSSRVADWWLWTLLGLGGIGIFAAARFFMAPREEESKLWLRAQVLGYAIVLILMLLAVFYSQSRGPQIGLIVGLLVFVDLLLLRRWRSTRNTGSRRAALWFRSLIMVGSLQLAGLAFLIFFNLSDSPAIAQLRTVPYVGRLGELTQTDEGTGRVRVLIWKGDGQGTGAVGLITSNPLRTIIGYGPETMFTVYNPFYPPELAKYEARGASPDRSHQAQLDELVTKGAIGLLSYLFLFLSAGWLAWRLLWRSNNLQYQLLYLGCLATILAHLFEGLSGIPIVSTLTMLWITFGLLVVGGRFDGQLSTASEPVPVPVAVTEQPIAAPVNKGRQASRTPRGNQSRGTTRAAVAPQRQGGSFRWMYVLVGVLTLFGIWFWNLKVVYADMAFNMSQAGVAGNDLQAALSKYALTLRAVQLAPNEDYYYLQLGNALIQLGYNNKLRNAQSEADLVGPRPNQRFDDLFQGANTGEAAINTFNNNTGQQLLEYARLVLEEADRLSPTNKDHPANLGRLHALWYQLTSDQTKLQTALKWYEEAARIAPNDVVILNEWATNLASLGPDQYPEVEAKFLKSQQLDPRFVDSYLKLGNFYRATSRLNEAGVQYGKALERAPTILNENTDPTLDSAIALLKASPEGLTAMADGLRANIKNQISDEALAALPEAQRVRRQTEYARAYAALGRVAAALNDKTTVEASFSRSTALLPTDVTIAQQYTLALSETLQYDAALQQAQRGLDLAKSQNRPEVEATLTQLIERIQNRKVSGGR